MENTVVANVIKCNELKFIPKLKTVLESSLND